MSAEPQPASKDAKGRVYSGMRIPRFKPGTDRPRITNPHDMNLLVDSVNSLTSMRIIRSASSAEKVLVCDGNTLLQIKPDGRDFAPIKATALKLAAYWTFDGPTGDQIDKVAGLHLVRSYTSGSTGTCTDALVSGIISNSLQINSVGGTKDSVDYLTPSSSQIGIDAHGFSLFGWYYNDGPIGASNIPFAKFFGTSNIRVEWTNDVSIHTDWKDDNGNISFSNFSATNAAWHFYHYFYDPVAQKLGFSIDGGAPSMFGTGLVFGAEGTMQFELNYGDLTGSTYFINWDETGLVVGGYLSTSQITSLYNSGAGVTWPAVKPIVES